MNKIVIYKTQDKKTEIEVQFEGDTVWLNQMQMAALFNQTKQNISLHIKNCFKERELNKKSTVKETLTVQTEGKRQVKRNIEYYNLDVIISVGYRVKSNRGTQFRQWASQRLKEYLIKGYVINEKRLAEKQQEIQYLKTGIRILQRVVIEQASTEESEILRIFSKGLELLDDYDNERLDFIGKTSSKTKYPEESEYLLVIKKMKSEFSSDIFARPKDESFISSIKQIEQSFNGEDLYRSIEEKQLCCCIL